jgi:hypothetical protein
LSRAALSDTLKTNDLLSTRPRRLMPPPGFAYAPAFDRNIGWVTEWEQQALRAKRVAIAGMGGVGGIHLLSLARLGIGRFSIADLDAFGGCCGIAGGGLRGRLWPWHRGVMRPYCLDQA